MILPIGRKPGLRTPEIPYAQRAMKRALLVLVALVGSAVALTGCESQNAAACQQYQRHFGGLPCAAGVESGIECEAFADHPCDLTPYFACLCAGQTCDEQQGLKSDVGPCAAWLSCGAVTDAGPPPVLEQSCGLP